MRDSTEIRNLAWKRLWTDGWFWRLFGGGLLLGLCGSAFGAVIRGILGRLNVRTWQDYVMAVIQNRQDLTTPVPNLTPDYIFQATSSGVLSVFIGYIMAGITAYGTAVILLRCLRNEENGWLGAAFGGFRDPFGMLWLFIRYALIFIGWGLFLIIPPLGIWLLIVAFYRYRFLWLVKAEHPDWSAGECLRSCRALTEGHKMDSFRLDCSYWKPITLMLLPVLMVTLALAAGSLFGFNGLMLAIIGLLGILCLAILVPLALIVPQYVSVGQGLFYLDLKDGPSTTQNERNT